MLLKYLIVISFTCSLTAHAFSVSNLRSILTDFDNDDTKLSLKSPGILIVAPGQPGYRLLTPDDTREESDENGRLSYRIIKRLLEKQSPKKDKELQYGKNILRAALIARCSKVDNCKKTCPSKSKKKKSKCQQKCTDSYDEENLCDEEPSSCEDDNDCGGGGKTMPPNWYL